MKKQYVVNLSKNQMEHYEEKRKNILLVEVTKNILVDGRFGGVVEGKGYCVEVRLSKEAMLRLGTELIKAACKEDDTFQEIWPCDRWEIRRCLGIYLHPRSCVMLVGQDNVSFSRSIDEIIASISGSTEKAESGVGNSREFLNMKQVNEKKELQGVDNETYIIDLQPLSDEIEDFEKEGKSVLQVRVKLPNGEWVGEEKKEERYFVGFTFTKDGLYGFGSELIRGAFSEEKVYWKLRPCSLERVVQEHGVYLHPESCGLVVIEEDFGVIEDVVARMHSKT